MEQGLVTTPEAAEAIGVCPDTLRAWAMKGIVRPAYRVGQTIRWDLNSLMAQLAAQEETDG